MRSGGRLPVRVLFVSSAAGGLWSPPALPILSIES